MTLEYPHFIVNFKRYDGTAGEDGLELARTIEAVAEKTGATFVVSPQTPDLRLFAERTALPIVAQAVDALEPGRGNGQIGIDAVAGTGADGLFVNHPESPATLGEIEATIERCRELDLESIVCVNSLPGARAISAFDPDCLLLERPEDVASDRAIPETHPELLEGVVSLARESDVRVLVGGGVSDAADVEAAFDMGADAAGASSAFVEATNRREWLEGIGDVVSDIE